SVPHCQPLAKLMYTWAGLFHFEVPTTYQDVYIRVEQYTVYTPQVESLFNAKSFRIVIFLSSPLSFFI
ncbi:hypothetical protein VFJ34_06570, partial [Streptococcus sp. R4]|uniref:hypothetical protein n=1 Tax=Streptococcus TaxID=1301 RepID=UPI002B4A3958